MTKRVRIAQGPIDFEDELEHASVLLEEVRDEAVAVAERAGEKHERPGVCILRQAVTRVGLHGSRPFLRLGMGPGAYDPASSMDALS